MFSFRRKIKYFRKQYPRFAGRTQFGVWRNRKVRYGYNKTVKEFHRFLRGYKK